MADVLLSTSVQGADGVKSILTALPSTTTLAQAQGFATGFLPLVDAISGAIILDASVTLPLTLPGGLKTTWDDTVSVHRGGLFGYDNTSVYKWSQFIPALLSSLFAGNLVNLGDADIAAYTDAMVNGITVSGTPIQPTDQYGFDLTAILTGKQSFRK